MYQYIPAASKCPLDVVAHALEVRFEIGGAGVEEVDAIAVDAVPASGG